MDVEAEKPQQTESAYECVVFDVDDTLYPQSSGLAAEISERIKKYMIQKLGIEESRVPALCVSLYKHYGTTMAGLRALGYSFDYADFHGFVHGGLSYDCLKPDPVLRNLLQTLPLRKLIFTNADETHAKKVLNKLGLDDCFEGIICFETLNPNSNGNGPLGPNGEATVLSVSDYSSISACELPRTPVICKPFEESFRAAFGIANIDPLRTVFVDDSIRNLQTGKKLGLRTIWAGSSHRCEGVDHALESIHNIKEALPQMWEFNQKSDKITCSEVAAVETMVRA